MPLPEGEAANRGSDLTTPFVIDTGDSVLSILLSPLDELETRLVMPAGRTPRISNPIY